MNLLGGELGVAASLLGCHIFVGYVVETRGGVFLKGDLPAVVDVLAPLSIRRLKTKIPRYEENSVSCEKKTRTCRERHT